MGNFDFVRVTLPDLHEDCARAESYALSDPAAAVVCARRAAERLVEYLYAVLRLPEPYRRDLSARIHAHPFVAEAGTGLVRKLDLVRTWGNRGAHPGTPVPQRVAVETLRELFHIMVWAGLHHSTNPGAVPASAQFDPAVAARSAPLTRAEVAKLAEKFAAQDAAHAEALEELSRRDELIAQRDAELDALRAQIAAAQEAQAAVAAASGGVVDPHDYREDATRDLFIDTLLTEAGWDLDAPGTREYRVTGLPTPSGDGRADYVLWGDDGLPLAVVEAKRTRVNAAAGRQQALLYADALERQLGRRPVIYYTNGYETYLWDDAAGYPPREIQGFATRDELELMVQRRTTRRPASSVQISSDIAGRHYQERAIRAIDDAFDKRRREALLVMATGSGKTRTVIALVDQLMRAGWVKRVLFLADRTALVTQAATAFKTHLPSATTVNVLGASAGDLAGGRVYVSTYPTMLNRMQDRDEAGRPVFGPAFFDLVVIDEAHRSVYAKYGAIFDYFDALLVGLTATPKDEVDHNTYRLFHLEDGVPTDAYGLDEAVDHGYLVPPRAISVGTAFTRQGIRYDELSEDEKDEWDALDWGDSDPPDQIDAEALNRFLFNADTVDKVLATLMAQGYKVAGGERIGKTIIFAKTQRHAEFIAERFDLGWPEHAGSLARVITSDVAFNQTLLDDFSVPDRAPHIAISVDMLDTGIDVPEVVNLVFFKTVHAKSKFWQMIGRGTRLAPDLFGPGEDKKDFFVFDFCGNLEFFATDPPTTEGSTQKSLTQRIVETRVALLRGISGVEGDDGDAGAGGLHASLADALHAFVTGMTLDNVLVRPHRRAVERLTQRFVWDALTNEDANAAMSVAGLPSGAVTIGEEDAKRFDLLILRRQLAQLEGDLGTAERCRETIQAVAVVLLGKTAIPSVATQAELLEDVASDGWWADVTLPALETVRTRVRGLVQFIEHSGRTPVYTDFADTLGEAREVTLPGTTPGLDPQRFRDKTRAYLREHEDHVALQKLRRNRQLTEADLVALEQMLVAAGTPDAAVGSAAQAAGGLGLFIRSLVGLERDAAAEAFSQFLAIDTYNVDQVRFVELIIDELTHDGAMQPGRLFESPFTDRAPTGPHYVFDDIDVDAIIATLRSVRERAVASDGVA